ncbi:hypothetical protein HA402_000539 [Bradysia odoriphaga]|nr:hypothetical protein HA402_000539 [Bradysia odoriphaga]
MSSSTEWSESHERDSVGIISGESSDTTTTVNETPSGSNEPSTSRPTITTDREERLSLSSDSVSSTELKDRREVVSASRQEFLEEGTPESVFNLSECTSTSPESDIPDDLQHAIEKVMALNPRKRRRLLKALNNMDKNDSVSDDIHRKIAKMYI